MTAGPKGLMTDYPLVALLADTMVVLLVVWMDYWLVVMLVMLG